MGRDWLAWHAQYEQHGPLAVRMTAIRRHIVEAVDDGPCGAFRLIGMCAGDGRDVSGALEGHPRRADIKGRLVELDPTLVARGRERLADVGLGGVEFVVGDASTTSAYIGTVPANLVLACGVFGNVSDEDVRNTIGHLAELCCRDATVIWTRHRRPPDLTPSVRHWFREAGFVELAFEAIPCSVASVGVNRLAGEPRVHRPGIRLFEFIR